MASVAPVGALGAMEATRSRFMRVAPSQDLALAGATWRIPVTSGPVRGRLSRPGRESLLTA